MRIAVRPFGDVPRGVLEDLVEDLAFLGTIEILEGAPLRREWFDEERGQYRADAFLDALGSDSGHRVLGVTTEEIYAEPYRFVFGQARIQGRPAILSLARLTTTDPSLTRDRVAKEAIHELGHTLGLHHCENRGCVMTFSNSAEEVDRKTRMFCRRCQVTVDFMLKRLRT